MSGSKQHETRWRLLANCYKVWWSEMRNRAYHQAMINSQASSGAVMVGFAADANSKRVQRERDMFRQLRTKRGFGFWIRRLREGLKEKVVCYMRKYGNRLERNEMWRVNRGTGWSYCSYKARWHVGWAFHPKSREAMTDWTRPPSVMGIFAKRKYDFEVVSKTEGRVT